MIKATAVLCGENAIRDAETNSISVINIIEGLVAQSFPIFVPKLYIFGLFTREEGDSPRVTVRLEMTLAKSKLFTQETELDFEDKKRSRFIVSIVGLALSGPGGLRFTFYEGKRRLGTYEVEILLKGGPEIKELEPRPKEKTGKRA